MIPAPGMQAGSSPGTPPADVLRAVVHEVRQPLSTIESIAYYLSLVLAPQDTKHREQLARIQQLVEQSNWILSNGLQLAEPVSITPEPIDIAEIIISAVSSRPVAAGAASDPPVQLGISGGLPSVSLDPGLGRSLIENILALFRQLATKQHPVVLRAIPRVQESAAQNSGVELIISTASPGFRSRAALPPGSAMSYDCVRRITELHRGDCSLDVDPSSGIRLRVVLP